MTDARAAKLEIVQRHSGGTFGILAPDSLYINGVEVLLPEDAKVEIAPISNKGFLTATVTFFVSELSVRAGEGMEYDIPGPTGTVLDGLIDPDDLTGMN